MPHLIRLTVAFSLMLATSASLALEPLFDGNFESGTLQGWSPDGSAIVASKGTCFSDQDTRALSIRGRFAGLLRSTKQSDEGQKLASFTSKPFLAGSGVVFLALSEQRDDYPKEHPFALNVSILDSAGNVLNTRPLATALSKLYGGCPSLTADQSFSQHFVSTRAYSGQQIKIRFTQHEDLAHTSAFTLIDEVSIVGASETPIYQSYPIANAGFAFNEGHLYLTAGLPAGSVSQTQDWQFSWLINGEGSRRPYYNPCIDDLQPGDYTANLYVRQRERLVTDTLHFSVPYIIYSETDIETEKEKVFKNSVNTANLETNIASATTVENTISNSNTINNTTENIDQASTQSSTASLVCNVSHPTDLSTPTPPPTQNSSATSTDLTL